MMEPGQLLLDEEFISVEGGRGHHEQNHEVDIQALYHVEDTRVHVVSCFLF